MPDMNNPQLCATCVKVQNQKAGWVELLCTVFFKRVSCVVVKNADKLLLMFCTAALHLQPELNAQKEKAELNNCSYRLSTGSITKHLKQKRERQQKDRPICMYFLKIRVDLERKKKYPREYFSLQLINQINS